jgi:hypothetical protein
MKKVVTIFILVLFLIPIIPINAKTIDINVKNISLPNSFTWQDVDGIDYTTPIKDQTPAPTCEAYALCASLETIMQHQSGELFAPDLSETHLYFYAGGTVEAGYVNLMDAADYLIDHGVPDEGCYPDPHRPFDYPFQSLNGWENRTVKIQEWGWVDHDIESIKTALLEYGPLVFCMSFTVDFFYYTSGVYKPKWGKHGGGHVITLVGYDDENECWILKNSWGKSWGEKGWFRLAYDADVIAPWYGKDTGIMYIDGVYGNFKPDVPKVNIEKPTFLHTYLYGLGIPTIFRKLPIQQGAARIFGDLVITVSAENTDSIEFYIDDELIETVTEEPFTCNLEANRGLHTLKIIASNAHNTSLDLEDIFVFF